MQQSLWKTERTLKSMYNDSEIDSPCRQLVFALRDGVDYDIRAC